MIRHRICPQCSTAVDEAAELCPGCKSALRPVVHLAPERRRAWKWRLLDWGLTAVFFFAGATALQWYYYENSPQEAASELAAARAELSLMSASERAEFAAAPDLCGFDNAARVAQAMARVELEAGGVADPQAILARCDEIAEQMRRLRLLN